MSKKLLYVAVAISACALSAIGCSKSSDDDAPPPQPVADPVPGSGATTGGSSTPSGGEAGIPQLHFDDAGTATPPADAGPDVQPVNVDPGAAAGVRIFATDPDGRLVSFRINALDKVSVMLVTGLAAGEKILNVTYRPSTGALYGLGSTSRLYTINTTSGAATAVGDGSPFTPAVVGQADGFDFNPMTDKVRVHTDVDQDLRIDPGTGKVGSVDGTLMFAPMDPNAGQSPNLVGTGYTNSVTPTPATTMLYAIDSTRNLLTRLPDPNTGMIETVGDMGVDFEPMAGFDIDKLGVAYAALHVGDETGLYTIDLASGASTKVGAISYPTSLTSIAVEP